jgi:hypothetical protein
MKHALAILAGVVRSELRAFAGVKAALEEGSEDGRLHCGPIEIGDPTVIDL